MRRIYILYIGPEGFTVSHFFMQFKGTFSQDFLCRVFLIISSSLSHKRCPRAVLISLLFHRVIVVLKLLPGVHALGSHNSTVTVVPGSRHRPLWLTICENFRLIELKLRPTPSKMRKNNWKRKNSCWSQSVSYQSEIFTHCMANYLWKFRLIAFKLWSAWIVFLLKCSHFLLFRP